MYNKMAVFILIFITTILSGCTSHYYRPVEDVDLVEVSYDSVDRLLEEVSQPIPKGSLIVVSTLVNVNDLEQTSAFGRIVSGQMASAFNNSGYRIKRMEMPTKFFVEDKGGMLHLTDEALQSLNKHQASAIVVGVFAAGSRTAYVSLRVVDILSQNTISSTDFSVPMGPDTSLLLETNDTGDAKPESVSLN